MIESGQLQREVKSCTPLTRLNVKDAFTAPWRVRLESGTPMGDVAQADNTEHRLRVFLMSGTDSDAYVSLEVRALGQFDGLGSVSSIYVQATPAKVAERVAVIATDPAAALWLVAEHEWLRRNPR